MIYGLQIIGILFALVMCYFTFLYFKRRDYDIFSFLFWIVVWLAFLLMVAFPSVVYSIMETLKIERTVDFFVIAGFLFFAVIIFHLYGIVKRWQKKSEEIVRKLAIKGKK